MTKLKYSVNDGRLPNLGTILMVERVLQKSKKEMIIPDIKRALPKKVMHQTLKIIISYLYDSKKIEVTPEGIRWVFKER
jgi:hypothetical protein